MNNTVRNVFIAAGTSLLVVLLTGAILWWFVLPRGQAALGDVGFGPGAMGPGLTGRGMMGRGFDDAQFGPMGRGMMREIHRMADVDSEYEYMSRMIPHHEEAIETARVLRAQTNRDEMRAFADRIIEVQSREVRQMERWLDEWYPDQPTRADYQPMMDDYRELEGNEVDVAFLQDMIPHHMAAIMMSQQLLARGLSDHDGLNDLAASIRNSQMTEIQEMNDWLREYTDE